MVKRALISVSDKEGIAEFARELNQLNIEIISSGGTHKLLADNGIKAKKVDEITDFPEILNGRVKTLHPKIHGGILAKRDTDHLSQLKNHQIPEIDLLVVNLYPFEETVANPSVTKAEAIEKIDVGGPTMIRAAAKNHDYVSVVVDKNDYQTVLDQLKSIQKIDDEMRSMLALKAFQHTAAYDIAIANYLNSLTDEKMPEQALFSFKKRQNLRYGENPHQLAAFYQDMSDQSITIANSKQLWGKELSYNNILDLDATLSIVLDFLSDDRCFVTIIKHTNPCGAALADSCLNAYKNAVACDPTSYFGGIVGTNQIVDKDAAEEMSKSFLECIIAAGFTPEALLILKTKKNIRLVEFDKQLGKKTNGQNIRRVKGGLLVQEYDSVDFDSKQMNIVSKRQIDAETESTLSFAWKMVKHVKSNAIIFAKDNMLIGVGAGQMSRVDSVKLAIRKSADAGLEISGSVLASDAFFPFRDGIDSAAEVGVSAIIQPGGSIKDQEVIEAADEHSIIMAFTGKRHFNH